MIKKVYSTFIIIFLVATIMPFFVTTAIAQEATSSINITNCDTSCMLTVSITSPSSVSEYQLSIKVPTNIVVDTSHATFTGFMVGSTVLSLDGATTDEYRWFNLQSQGGTTGTLSVPISNVESGNTVSINKADILDTNGNRITAATTSYVVSSTVTVILTSTSLTTLTSTTTSTVRNTITSTTTLTATTTSTTTSTITSTVGASTSTATTTLTTRSTQTITTTVGSSTVKSTINVTNTSTIEEQIDSTSTISLVVAAFAVVLLGIAIVLKIRNQKIPF